MTSSGIKMWMTPPHPGAFIRTEALEELGLIVAAARILGVRRAPRRPRHHHRMGQEPDRKREDRHPLAGNVGLGGCGGGFEPSTVGLCAPPQLLLPNESSLWSRLSLHPRIGWTAVISAEWCMNAASRPQGLRFQKSPNSSAYLSLACNVTCPGEWLGWHLLTWRHRRSFL